MFSNLHKLLHSAFAEYYMDQFAVGICVLHYLLVRLCFNCDNSDFKKSSKVLIKLLKLNVL